MSTGTEGGGKRYGKTEWAGRRRPATRSAGFHVSADATGGELEIENVTGWHLEPGSWLKVVFRFPPTPPGTLLGFGAWYNAPQSCTAQLHFGGKHVLTDPAAPDWSKVGSVWTSDGRPVEAVFRLTSSAQCTAAVYGQRGGAVGHKYFEGARPALLRNTYRYTPEGNFYLPEFEAEIQVRVSPKGTTETGSEVAELHLKSCNRCARFLPINVHNERLQLSFNNHCVAPHRLPCKHATFGRLRNVATGDVLQLQNGFQLECRFCKKWEVNAAHNPQRTAGQMKEDAARRRALELLLTQLYGGSSPLLAYRSQTGRELADDVYERFDGRCFKCGTSLASSSDMNLDHTRPLALLWPLDGTATALCGIHNSEKRDKSPSEYYSGDELERLADLTRIPLDDLATPGPNPEAIGLLTGRLDWFFDEFLMQPDLQTVREGKLPADLLVKALQKALNRDPRGSQIDLEGEYQRRSRLT